MRWLSDRGSSGVFFAVLAPSLIALAGLVLDGGRAIVSKQQAGNVALEAARAAASECDQTALFHGEPCEVADTVQACQVAADFIQHEDAAGGATLKMTGCDPIDPAPDGVHYLGFRVTVQATADTSLIGIVGINQINVQSTQSARSVTQEG